MLLLWRRMLTDAYLRCLAMIADALCRQEKNLPSVEWTVQVRQHAQKDRCLGRNKMKDTNRVLSSVIRNDNLFVSARLCNEKRLKRHVGLTTHHLWNPSRCEFKSNWATDDGVNISLFPITLFSAQNTNNLLVHPKWWADGSWRDTGQHYVKEKPRS